MYKFSIIIPHYNSVTSLKKLLNSIPKTNDIQVIVIDDKSNKNGDYSNLIIANKKNTNLLFLENETNKKGAGVCRNIGLKKAEGKWILFADADDYFLDGFYNIICKDYSSNYDVIFYTPTSIEIDTNNKSNRHHSYENIINNYNNKKDTNKSLFLRYTFHVPWSKMIRNSFIKENNIYFDEVIASNDIMFSTKVGYYMQKFKASEDIIYCVTKYRGSLTTNVDMNIYDTRLEVFINYCNFLKKKLNKEDLKVINLNGRGMLITSLKYGLGFKKFFLVYINLKINHIKIFDIEYLNPIKTLKKVQNAYELFRIENKYYNKS